MKLTALLVAFTALLSTTAFADNAQRLLGECTITNVNILKGKEKGLHQINKRYAVVIDRNYGYLDEGQQSSYDNTMLAFSDEKGYSCPTTTCYAPVLREKPYNTDADAPQKEFLKVNQNDAQKLDILIKTNKGSNNWVKVSYDYETQEGKFEYRQKLNSWFEAAANEHHVVDLKDCTFQAPLDFSSPAKE